MECIPGSLVYHKSSLFLEAEQHLTGNMEYDDAFQR